VQDISLKYEGHTEEVLVRPPDLSRRGMFISTSRTFPEGAVLNLRFWPAVTGIENRTRCEVRHCLAGVGVGVEFVGLSSKAANQIDEESSYARNDRTGSVPGKRKREIWRGFVSDGKSECSCAWSRCHSVVRGDWCGSLTVKAHHDFREFCERATAKPV